MFEPTEENKENEKGQSNPIMEFMKVDDDDNEGGLSRLFRQSSLQLNVQIVSNKINNNINI